MKQINICVGPDAEMTAFRGRDTVDSWGRRLYCYSCGRPLPKAKTKPRVVCGERECELKYRREVWRRNRGER